MRDFGPTADEPQNGPKSSPNGPKPADLTQGQISCKSLPNKKIKSQDWLVKPEVSRPGSLTLPGARQTSNAPVVEEELLNRVERRGAIARFAGPQPLATAARRHAIAQTAQQSHCDSHGTYNYRRVHRDLATSTGVAKLFLFIQETQRSGDLD